MNTIALIEDKSRDFESVKSIFSDTSKQIWPNYEEFWKMVLREDADSQAGGFEDELISNICDQIEGNIDNLSAIIMDISLYSKTDEVGIEIIRQIRKKEDVKFKLIPIFCYSRHGDSEDIRKKAYAAGATNIFNKEVVDDHSRYAKKDIAELKISVDSQMLAYQLAHYSISSLKKVEDYLKKDALKIDFLVEGIISLMKLDNIIKITDNKEKEQMLEGVFGGKEQFNEVKNKMYQFEDANDQTELLNDISDVLSQIPGLNVVSIVLKVLSMIRKNTD